MIEKEKYNDCVKHIENHWDKLTFYLPEDKNIHIGLPDKFVSPTSRDGYFEYDQFYWDSYFIILGLLASGKVSLARGMVDNFAHLKNRFGIIPLRNRFFNLGISQPPFLSSMVLEIFNKENNKNWLKKLTKTIEEELTGYWMDDKRAAKHLAYSGLSRYCDHHVNHVTAEHESGWDMTSRFYNKCLDYLPVDLNSLLYKYEKDLSDIYKILNDKDKSEKYKKMADLRKSTINSLMWNEKKGFFFDFNYKFKRTSKFYSLAGFFPLWAGLANDNQAKKCFQNLKKFEYKYGLATTKKVKSREFKQWDYPNGWPNLQWIVIKGLINYGYNEKAEKLAKKWLDLNKKVFEIKDEFFEKYDVVKGDTGKEGRYPNQKGFGFTNGVFIKLLDQFS
jgi:alpha,alpha-trehalase